MAQRRPLVLDGGQIKELPAGDTLPAGSSGGNVSLFKRFLDATTTGTVRESLYTDSIPGLTLGTDGDSLKVEYGGIYAANGNNKRVYVSFGGTDIVDSTTLTENDKHWDIDLTILRKDSATVRCISEFIADGVAAKIKYTEITGLTLSAVNDLKLEATTSGAAGDVTAKLGTGVFMPAVASGLHVPFVNSAGSVLEVSLSGGDIAFTNKAGSPANISPVIGTIPFLNKAGSTANIPLI
jgi:hypothetical protein